MGVGALIDYALASVEEPERAPRTAEIRAASSPRLRRSLELARGEANERRLLRVLSSFPRPPWLVQVRRARLEEDRAGADLVALASDGREAAIQVKSSVFEARRFVEHGRRIGVAEGSIAVVVVRDDDEDRELFDRTIRRLVIAFRFSSHR